MRSVTIVQRALASALCLLAAGAAHALGTAAGTDITNTATVSADVGGSPRVALRAVNPR